ncbi:MAG: hypothetical protein HC828_10010 [Blastochloris sp.]|nr:hypothetical protein [Blastochloris sp.]
MHANLLFTIVFFLLIIGGWGVINHIRKRVTTRGYHSALAIGELLLLAEFIIGVLLFTTGLRAYRMSVHIIYGVVAIIAIPAVYLYLRGRDTRWEQLIYAMTCLFLSAIALRALETGQAPE